MRNLTAVIRLSAGIPWIALFFFLACGGARPAVETAPGALRGWEYRLVPALPAGTELPLSPPLGGEFSQHLGGPSLPRPSLPPGQDLDLWLRVPLAGEGHGEARLFFHTHTPVFALYLDGTRIYEHGSTARVPSPADSRLTYHVTVLPPGPPGQVLQVWIWRPRTSFLSGGEWEVVPRGALASSLSRYVKGPIKADSGPLLVGGALCAVGALALALTLLRFKRRDLLLLSFGGFCLLYGVRALLERHLVLLLDLPTEMASYARSFATYLILVPAWAFFVKLFGPGRWSLNLWSLRVFMGFAGAGILSDLVQGAPFTLTGWPNNVLVIAGLLVLLFNLFPLSGSRLQRSPDQGLVLMGCIGLGIGALHDNLAGLLPGWPLRIEWIGFLFFVGCLGYVAANRSFDNEKRLVALESELETARRIQASILPRGAPRMDGLALGCRYVPMSAVAGDFYDFHRVASKRLGILVADVAGHGVPAALIASMVKVAVSSQLAQAPEERHDARDPKDAARVLSRVNRLLCEHLRREFVTAVYVFFDLDKQELVACGGGHPYPLLWRGADKKLTEITAPGVLLGRFPKARFQNVRHDFKPGDRLLLYTDGLIEALDPQQEMYGEERLRNFIRRWAHLAVEDFVESLVDELQKWSRRSLSDDLTLVVADFMDPHATSSRADNPDASAPK